MRSILALERAEYLGRRAGVRYSRSLVARSTGSRPAISKMTRGKWNQEGGAPPPMWKRAEMARSTRAMGVGQVLLNIGMAGRAIEDVIGREGDELGVHLAAGEGEVPYG